MRKNPQWNRLAQRIERPNTSPISRRFFVSTARQVSWLQDHRFISPSRSDRSVACPRNESSPVTVAGPRRNRTDFPIKSASRCWQDTYPHQYVVGRHYFTSIYRVSQGRVESLPASCSGVPVPRRQPKENTARELADGAPIHDGQKHYCRVRTLVICGRASIAATTVGVISSSVTETSSAFLPFCSRDTLSLEMLISCSASFRDTS